MDLIANLITEIKNASAVGKETVVFTFSKFYLAIAEALARRGFVKSVAKKGKKLNRNIEIVLAYDDKIKKVNGARRISRRSKRVYYSAEGLRSIRHGAGALFLSTTKGVLSNDEAKKANVGGEALFEIW